MSDDDPSRSDEPVDRLTRLTADMTAVLDVDPANADVRAIVLLHDDQRGGIQVHGYDDPDEAVADLLVHLRALLRTYGTDLSVLRIPDSPGDL